MDLRVMKTSLKLATYSPSSLTLTIAKKKECPSNKWGCWHRHTENKACGAWKKISQSSKRRRQWHPNPVLLPGKSHGWRSLVGCSPWGRKESDTTERLHFQFSFSCIGEGNGNPLQCSCLENPRDSGAWRAVVYGVAQSRTRLKQHSSSSSKRKGALAERNQPSSLLERISCMWI